jgi:hypothetical protein
VLAAPIAARADEPVAPEPARRVPVVTRTGWPLLATGYLQLDAIPWNQASVDELDPGTGAPLNQTGLVVRRARLRVEASRDGLSGGLELDGNTLTGPSLRLLGAQVGYALPDGAPRLGIVGGLIKIPFGAEVPAAERDKAFLEPPTWARALFPGNYDVGAQLHGELGLARWSVALMNGAPVGDAQWRGKDPSASYDLIGRLGAVVLGPRHLRVEAGVSALHGSGLHAGTPPIKDSIQWVDGNLDGIVQLTELQVVPGTPGTPSQAFARQAVGGDLQVRWCTVAGDGAAFVEGVLATNLDRGVRYADPIATTRDLRELGVSLGVVQGVLGRGELGVRYDRYEADRDASQQAGVTVVGAHPVFATLAVMAAAHVHGARLVVEYDHERNPLGRGLDGTPTTRAADRVTLRAQVGF